MRERHVRAVFIITLLLLPLQLVMIAFASEPFPGAVGPLFMGNRDLGEGVLNYRQDFVLRRESTGEEVRVDPLLVMGVPEPYALNIRLFRFPLALVDASGQRTESQSLGEKLAAQGHKFQPTRFHRHLTEELTEEERRWLRAHLGDQFDPEQQSLVVRWVRELYTRDAQGAFVLSEETLNEYHLKL